MSSKTEKKSSPTSSSKNSKTKKIKTKQIKGYKVELELIEPSTSTHENLDIETFKDWCENNLLTQIGYLGAEKICNVSYKIKSNNVLKMRFYLDIKDHSHNDAEDYCDYIRNFNDDNKVKMNFKVQKIKITELYKAFKCNYSL